MNHAFDRVLILGAVDREALPPCGDVTVLPPQTLAPQNDLLPVEDAVRWARQQKPRRARLLLITDRDLFIPECASLFAFADVKGQVAIVSTFRLTTADRAQSRARIANAIAHERGHLDGLRHCHGACLMRQAADAAELDSRPSHPCGKCPRRWSVITKSVIALFVVMLIVGVAERVLERRAPQRVAPAMPSVFSAAFAEFPRDPDAVFSRPVTMVAHLLDAPSGRLPLLADSTLPPGLTTATLPRFAVAITSAVFRTVNPLPIVHVHVIETRRDGPSLPMALGCAPPAASSVAYASCHVRHDARDVHVVTRRTGERVIVVFSPDVSGRAMAERLAATVGTSAGLLRDRDLNLLIGGLPAVLPATLAMHSIVASNLHRVPESVDQLAVAILGDDHSGAAAQFRRVMPLAITAAHYRNPAGGLATIVVGDYGSAASAWVNWQLMKREIAPLAGDVVTMGGDSARRVTSGTRRGVLFRRGQFVVSIAGDGAIATDAMLSALAAALQL